MRVSHGLLHGGVELLDVFLAQRARLDEPGRELLATVGWLSIVSYMSGCVYAGSPSLCPKRR